MDFAGKNTGRDAEDISLLERVDVVDLRESVWLTIVQDIIIFLDGVAWAENVHLHEVFEREETLRDDFRETVLIRRSLNACWATCRDFACLTKFTRYGMGGLTGVARDDDSDDASAYWRERRFCSYK